MWICEPVVHFRLLLVVLIKYSHLHYSMTLDTVIKILLTRPFRRSRVIVHTVQDTTVESNLA